MDAGDGCPMFVTMQIVAARQDRALCCKQCEWLNTNLSFYWCELFEMTLETRKGAGAAQRCHDCMEEADG